MGVQLFDCEDLGFERRDHISDAVVDLPDAVTQRSIAAGFAADDTGFDEAGRSWIRRYEVGIRVSARLGYGKLDHAVAGGVEAGVDAEDAHGKSHAKLQK